MEIRSFENNALAVVFGAGGGIGHALVEALEASGAFARVFALSRKSDPAVDITEEASIEAAAAAIRKSQGELRLVIDATGFLHDSQFSPEKTYRHIHPAHMAHAFAVNAIGPALLMKHVLPLLARDKKAVFASLSAKVGSIGDNAIGGWYSYRASKAALNQLIRTAAIEIRRTRPDTIVCALHPGTVDTALSAPFSKQGLNVRSADEAARDLLSVIENLNANDSGTFISYDSQNLPW